MTRLPAWADRPADVANLLNPAYCSVVLGRVCEGYQTASEGMPFALAFIAMPLLLQRDCAMLLPVSSRTKLHLWLNEYPEVALNFANRARGLAPYVKESISYGLSSKVLGLTPAGQIIPKPVKALKAWEEQIPPRVALKQAVLVGKLLAAVNDVPTIFSMFGVRP